jgi:hypothetical protein
MRLSSELDMSLVDTMEVCAALMLAGEIVGYNSRYERARIRAQQYAGRLRRQQQELDLEMLKELEINPEIVPVESELWEVHSKE